MAKISARGRHELRRWVRDDAVMVLCSDGKVLYRRTRHSGYVVLPNRSAAMAASPAAWRALLSGEQEERIARMADELGRRGWKVAVLHVTPGSHEQRNGAYWANFRRRFGC